MRTIVRFVALILSAIIGSMWGWWLECRHQNHRWILPLIVASVAILGVLFRSNATWVNVPLVFYLTAAASADLAAKEIPNEIALFGLLSGLGIAAVNGRLMSAVGWGFGAFAVGFVLALIGEIIYRTEGAFGMGDVKAMGVLGAWLGPQFFQSFLWACIINGLVALLIILQSRGRRKNKTIPFFPAMALAVAYTLG